MKIKNKLQNIIIEIVHEKNKSTRLDETIYIYEEYTDTEALKIENNLLKQLYNKTQKKLLLKERQISSHNNNNVSIKKSLVQKH